MTTTGIKDYLTKQLSVSGNIVTFRSLSRQLGIHVNAAKNELASYYAENSSTSLHATYLISGQVPLIGRDVEDDGMSVDEEVEEVDFEEDDEDVDKTQTRIVMVGEKDLEASKSEFTQISAVHVYSLSPAPIHDAGLVCTLTPDLRVIDAKQVAENKEWATLVGKLVGSHIALKPGKQPIASSSKLKPTTAVQSKPAVVPKIDLKPTLNEGKDKDEAKPKPKVVEKLKTTGKLDWSNAKTKDMKKEEAKATKAAEKEKKDAKAAEAKAKKEKDLIARREAAKLKQEEKESEEKTNLAIRQTDKRGTKRKSAGALLSDSDSEPEPEPKPKPRPQPASKYRQSTSATRAKALLSSDEEEEEDIGPRRRLRKGKKTVDTASDEENTKSLRAMMDVDDDQVIRVSRTSASTPVPPTEEETSDSEVIGSPAASSHEDVDMSSDIEVKPKARKRKVKKVVPIGKNGLPKTRVEKSRKKMENGYMVTEDYSSYESVSESEVGRPIQTEGNDTTKINSEISSKKTKKNSDSMQKPKPSGSGSGKPVAAKNKSSGGAGKGSIQNFFGRKD